MDLWVAAAAAGAGYLAKYWKNVKGIQGLPEAPAENLDNKKSKFASSFSKNFDQKRVKLGGLDGPFGRWVRRKSEKQTSSNVEEDETVSDTSSCLNILGSPMNERVPTSGEATQMQTNLREHENGNALSLLSLHTQLSGNENHEDGNRTSRIGDFADIPGCETNDQANLLQVGMGYGFSRFGSSLNSKRCHGYSIKPLPSHEKCVELGEYDFSSLPSPASPIGRPFQMNDNQITRNMKSNEDPPSSLQAENVENRWKSEDRVGVGVTDTLIGLPPPFEEGLVELRKKTRRQRGKSRQRISHMSNAWQFHSEGSPDGALLFCLGIGIGSMSTLLSNKSEVDKLNTLLKQTQNLVQDLQEELEMKDTLTVKELAYENCRFQELDGPSSDIKVPMSQQPYQGSISFSFVQGASMLPECYNHKAHDQEEGEDLYSLSKIEAELEAELARLELNINTSSRERTSNFGELDTEFSGDIVHGELKANMVNWAVESDQDACSSSDTCPYPSRPRPSNHAVSPRELSLRLHELIESRLEERILELESTLEDSQKQLHLMETELVNSQWGFSSGEIGSLSIHGSPTVMERPKSMSPPIFLNMLDNSLNSYDEAYVEFEEIAKIKKENITKQINGKRHRPLDHSRCQGWADDGDNGSLLHLEMDKRKPNEISESDDDNDDDELGKLLIKRIVEKTRQGSPVVLNAQRMLFSMDE